jgi:periplasmic copper chaperone A
MKASHGPSHEPSHQPSHGGGRPRLPRRVRAAGRVFLVLGGAGAGLLALAGPAFAHVTITPGSAPQGSTAELTFKVPNEESKAATVELQVQVPTAHPIAQFLVKPVPGWTVTVQTVTLPKPIVTDDGSFATAVSEVTWKGGTIQPGQYQDFSVSADPLPSGVGQLVFKAVQTYSNGDVVRWIDLPQAGQPEPEHPAPVLALTRAGASADAGDAAGAQGDPAAASAAGSGTGSSTDTTALALGAAGLAAGLLGLAAGGAAWRRGRRDRRP